MRFRPLNRHDAWRSIPQTLCMRGFGIVILASFGLVWPDLALDITLVDIAIICLLFAMADIDGGLIGGASLKAAEFLAIARA